MLLNPINVPYRGSHEVIILSRRSTINHPAY